MTVYFPLVVHGAFLIEPTETESKETLDSFIAAMRDLAQEAKRGNKEFFQQSPRFAPRRRLDETRAARQPVLKYTPMDGDDADDAVAGGDSDEESEPARLKAAS
jgi:glycine dehydrogenase subunit 2